MSFSTFLEDKVLRHVFCGVPYTAPTTLYLALWTDATVPTDATAGTEVSGGSYARQAIATSGWTVSGAAPTQIANVAQILFAPASADWGNIKYAAIMDASSGGNVLDWGALTSLKNVTAGDLFTIPANGIAITLN